MNVACSVKVVWLDQKKLHKSSPFTKSVSVHFSFCLCVKLINDLMLQFRVFLCAWLSLEAPPSPSAGEGHWLWPGVTFPFIRQVPYYQTMLLWSAIHRTIAQPQPHWSPLWGTRYLTTGCTWSCTGSLSFDSQSWLAPQKLDLNTVQLSIACLWKLSPFSSLLWR